MTAYIICLKAAVRSEESIQIKTLWPEIFFKLQIKINPEISSGSFLLPEGRKILVKKNPNQVVMESSSKAANITAYKGQASGYLYSCQLEDQKYRWISCINANFKVSKWWERSPWQFVADRGRTLPGWHLAANSSQHGEKHHTLIHKCYRSIHASEEKVWIKNV